jgi:hypothetical protein
MAQGIDQSSSGYCSKHEVNGACATLGLVLTGKEFSGLAEGSIDASGRIAYAQFCAALSAL